VFDYKIYSNVKAKHPAVNCGRLLRISPSGDVDKNRFADSIIGEIDLFMKYISGGHKKTRKASPHCTLQNVSIVMPFGTDVYIYTCMIK
jgi:hypothetical protein